MRTLLVLTTSILAPTGLLHAQDAFARPGHGVPDGLPVWGHREGLRIGLAPTPGPQGLIRVYAPFLGQKFPRMVNYISIEPLVKGQKRRGQSELEMSRDRPGERGLTFWASTGPEPKPRPKELVEGVIANDGTTLRLFIHTEPFRNGAHPVIECVFHRGRPFEVELITHAAEDSAPMASCVLSATMGNYGQLRRIHLKNDRVVSARKLWDDEPLDKLKFLPWRTWPAKELERTEGGDYVVKLSTDAADPAAVEYHPDVPPHWRYVGKKAIHYWRTEGEANPTAAVNGRKTYWMSNAPIPGGIAFENFELGLPFKSGQRLWFGVRPDRD